MKRFLPLSLVFLVFLPSTSFSQNPMVTIDIDEISEPISPYIYGQFIEHLGRCIYGGLWAEMLEDRKFYYPITGKMPAWEFIKPGGSSYEGEGLPYELLVRSPWTIIGDTDNVRMVTLEPYSGDHEPEIAIGEDSNRAGIAQERLALEAGRRYSGHVVMSGDLQDGEVEIKLVWGAGASDRLVIPINTLEESHTTVTFVFESGKSTDNGRIEIVASGSGSFRVGAVSLMPEDNLFGWRKDTVALLRELDAPVYRWPGGNFVSGYDWEDGIGERDRRPSRKNPAWKGIETNDVGIDEYMTLMRLIDAEAFIAVNTGLGEAESAVAQIEYVNGAQSTPMGRRRAENGHANPYDVRWWAIGNEMYGSWQLGHMPLSEYTGKHNRIVEEMKKVDPEMKPIAVGAMGEWSREMLSASSGYMDLISEHLYWQDRDDLVEHVAQISARIQEVADAHRTYRSELSSLQGKDIRIAMDEWNYWYGPNEFGELGVRYFLQDALGIAAGLHAFFRNSDMYFMANYAQTVNVIGAIKTTKTAAEFEPTGLALKMYREHFGTLPVKVSSDFSPLDISAALTKDRNRLTIAIVNPTSEAVSLPLELNGGNQTGDWMVHTLTGPGRYAGNIPDGEREVDIHQSTASGPVSTLNVEPLSITIFTLVVN